MNTARPLSRMGKLAPAAFTTLPLAMFACMANPALAAPITLSNPTCAANIGTGSCAPTVTNGAAGNSLGVTLTSPVVSGNDGGRTAAQFYATDSASGQLQTSQSLAVAFDFTVDRTNIGADSLNYSITFNVGDSGCSGKGGACNFMINGVIPNGSGAYQVSGSQTFSLPAGTLSSESLFLYIVDPSSSATSFSITSATIGGTNGTLAAPTAVTPEPTSLLLAGTGMALAALRRRRRKSA